MERKGDLNSAIEIFEQVASDKKNHLNIQANAWFRLGRLTSGVQRKQFLQNCLILASDHTGAKKLLAESKSLAVS